MELKVTAEGAAAAGVVKTSQNIAQKALGVITLPLAAFKKEEASGAGTYVSEQSAGVAVIGAAVAGFMAGDLWGAKVPFLGGRR